MFRQTWSDLSSTYGAAWAFGWSYPLLFFIPVLAEFVQHVAEIWLGMYESRDAFISLQEHPIRFVFGVFKVIAISLPSYWFVRYLWFRDSGTAVEIFESRSLRLWSVVVIYLTCGALISLFWTSIFGVFGVSEATTQIASGVFTLFLSVLGIFLTVWVVAWPLGKSEYGPLRSIRIMRGNFMRAIVYLIGAIGLYMPAHFALNSLALERSQGAIWLLLGLDSIVVGFLSLNLCGVNYFVAKRALHRQNDSLHSEFMD